MVGVNGKSGGKREGSGRKPTLLGKRYHVYLDEDTIALLDKIIEQTYQNESTNYKRSEMLRRIVKFYDEKYTHDVIFSGRVL